MWNEATTTVNSWSVPTPSVTEAIEIGTPMGLLLAITYAERVEGIESGIVTWVGSTPATNDWI